MNDGFLSSLKELFKAMNFSLEVFWMPDEWMRATDEEFSHLIENPNMIGVLDHIGKEAMSRTDAARSRLAVLAGVKNPPEAEKALGDLLEGIDYARRAVASENNNQTALTFFMLGVQLMRANDQLKINVEAESAKADQKNKKRQAAAKAANARHDKPGGSREIATKIRDIWATGKYTSRDICAEQEWEGLGFNSLRTARGALTGTPDPANKQSQE